MSVEDWQNMPECKWRLVAGRVVCLLGMWLEDNVCFCFPWPDAGFSACCELLGCAATAGGTC
jgi:hypothetical protein